MPQTVERLKSSEFRLDYDWNAPFTTEIAEPTPYQAYQVKVVSEDLRDGLHGVSEYPPVEKMLQYIDVLRDLGITNIVVGVYSGEGSHLNLTIKKILKETHNSFPEISPIVLSLATEDSLRWAGECREINPNLETIVFMGTAPSRLLVEGWEEDYVLRQLSWAVSKATNEYGLNVIGATEHTTQTPPDFLKKIIKVEVEAGARTFCIADTIGGARPIGAYQIVSFVKEVLEEIGAKDVLVDWHGHDDMGNAVANSFFAIAAGANRVHAVARGVGERAGNTRMEALLLNLNAIVTEGGLKSPWKMEKLSQVLSLYDQLIKSPPPRYGPLGERSHITSLGIHAAAMLKAAGLVEEIKATGDDELTRRVEEIVGRVYTAVAPLSVGKKNETRISHWSGENTVKLAYSLLGGDPESLSKDQIGNVLMTAKSLKRELTDEELNSLLNGHK